MEKQKLIEALKKLDSANDNHWTTDGKPKVDTVKFLAGGTVTREDIDAVAPDFTRDNRVVKGEEESGAATEAPVTQGSDTAATGSEAAQQNQDASQAPPSDETAAPETDGGPAEEVDADALAAAQKRNEDIAEKVKTGEISADGDLKLQPGDALNPTANSPAVGVEQLGVVLDDEQTASASSALDFALKGLDATVSSDTDVENLSDEELNALVAQHSTVMSAINQLVENVKAAGRAKLAVLDNAIIEQHKRSGGSQRLTDAENAAKFREAQATREAPAPTLRQNYVNPIDDPSSRKRGR